MKNLLRISSPRTNTLVYAIPQMLLSLPKIPYLTILKFLMILSLVSIISFLALYIYQITTAISQGYQIQNYQNKIGELAQENKILQINSVKINSLENINSEIQELGFERIDKVHYIQILENSVVSKDKKVE